MKWVIWRIWLGTPSKWLEWTLWESPYELRMSVPIKVTWDEWFDQTLSKWMESMRNEWIEVNRVKWVNWRIWLCEPYGKIPMVRTRCPYESDLRWVIWSNPIKMIRFNEKWMNWSEMKWNEWIEGSELEQPYGNGPMVDRRCPYQSDLRWVIWSFPFKMIRIDEIWMNWSE